MIHQPRLTNTAELEFILYETQLVLMVKFPKWLINRKLGAAPKLIYL